MTLFYLKYRYLSGEEFDAIKKAVRDADLGVLDYEVGEEDDGGS